MTVPIDARNSNGKTFTYGVLHFPAKVVPCGWRVSIRPVEHRELEKPVSFDESNSGCHSNDNDEENNNEDEPLSRQLVSLAFDVTIHDPEGREHPLQNLLNNAPDGQRHLGMKMRYLISSDQRAALGNRPAPRFVYLEDGDLSWKPLENKGSTSNPLTEDFGTLDSVTSHLTSINL